MANVLIDLETEECLEAHIVHVGEQAIPFERFLDMVSSRFIELVNSVIVEKPEIHRRNLHNEAGKINKRREAR